MKSLSAKWYSNVKYLWVGQSISLIGNSIVQFALIWYLTQKTDSEVILSIATLINYIPIIFLNSFIGSLVDKLGKKSVMICASLLSVLGTVVLIILNIYSIDCIYFVFFLFFLRSVCQQFQMIAMNVSVSISVPDERLDSASGINQTINGVRNLVAPVFGAFLLDKTNLMFILLVECVTAVIGIFFVLLFRIEKNNRSRDAIVPVSLIANFKILRSYKTVFFLAGFASILNFVAGPSAALLPIMVHKEMHASASMLALLQTCLGFGFIAGGLLISVWGGFNKRMITVLCGTILFGSGLLLGSLTVYYHLSVFVTGFALFVVGFGMTVSNSIIFAIFQLLVPKDEQGRLFGTVSSISTAIIPVGLLIATPISSLMGIKGWYLCGGILCVSVSLMILMNSEIMNSALRKKRVEIVSHDI